jgi:phenylalanyl-tRNA synthetase beta subunit
VVHHVLGQQHHALDLRTVDSAIAITEFYRLNTERAFAHVSMTDEQRKVMKIIDKIKMLGGRAKPQQIQQSLRKSIQFTESHGIIEELISSNIIEVVFEKNEKLLILKNGT